MDKAIRGALVGMVLGDAYVNVRHRLKDGKYHYESAEMRIVHSLVQIDYCRHKCDLVNQWLDRHSTMRVISNGPGGQYKAAAFSVSHPYFRQVKQWCYPGGKKTFSMHLLDMLTPHGLALWYMDDGSAGRNLNKDGWTTSVSTSLATFCSEPEARLIAEWFDKVYAIRWNVRCKKTSPPESAFYLQTNTEGSKEFAALIRMFVIPSMLYKLAHVAAMTTHERQTPVAVCRCGNLIYENRNKGMCHACYMRQRRMAMI